MITLQANGKFQKANSFLERLLEVPNLGLLDKYGQRGVEALSKATPTDTGLAKQSWYYTIEHYKGGAKIVFCNSDIEDGFPVAVMLQYGHASKSGSWVEGVDYINPALKPIFEDLKNELWREVTRR